MFIPIRSDRPLRTTPYVNYALIAINVIVFALTARPIAMLPVQHHPVYEYYLHHDNTKLWQFISYQFLHADGWHLVGNMIFLWVFGNAVEDRLGKLGYLFFYLAMGVFAGLAHWMTSIAPVLGASGSVAGVTGAFLALFPRTRVTFFYFWFMIGTFEIPAMVVVLFYFLKDLLFFSMSAGQVAYSAHLAGNAAGFVVAMTLLGTRLLSREPYDLFSMWQHRRRREQFRKITHQGYHAWEGRAHVHAQIGTKGKPGPVMTEQDKALLEQRQSISRAISGNEMSEAARLYNQLVDSHGEQVLSQRHQFDIANTLFGMGDYPHAARAYDLLLKTYPGHDERAHAQLMLGLIRARYLGQPEQARALLQEASQRLQGDDAALARQILAEIARS